MIIRESAEGPTKENGKRKERQREKPAEEKQQGSGGVQGGREEGCGRTGQQEEVAVRGVKGG